MNDGEKRLVEFHKGISGSFFSFLFNAIFKADSENMAKLKLAFPQEVEAVRRFRSEDNYWQTLEQEYML